MKLKWKKMPSVRSGGKPFFWVAWINNGVAGWVVWNRVVQLWEVQDSNCNVVTTVKRDIEGKRFFENRLIPTGIPI